MENSYAKLFRSIPDAEPCSIIFEKVLIRIEESKVRKTKIDFAGFTTLALVAVGSFVPAVIYIENSLAKSGFYDYASLLVSDSAFVFLNWKSLLFSLVDTVPITEIVVSLGLVSIFIYSLHKVIRDQSILFARTSHNISAQTQIS